MDGKKLAEHIKTAYEAPGGKELFWEQVPLDVFKSSYQVAIQECSEQDVVEIDTYKELKAADNTYTIRLESVFNIKIKDWQNRTKTY